MKSKAATKSNSKSASGKTLSKGGGRGPSTPRPSTGGFSHLRVYVRYTKLTNKTLMEILQHLEEIKDAALQDYFRATGIVMTPLPSINITYMATGRSITFKYGGGLLPSIKTVNGQLEVNVSEKVAVPFIVAFFLFKAYAAYLDIGIKYKEKQSVDLDIALKQLELEEKQEQKSERDDKGNSKTETATIKLIEYIHNNPDIIRFDVNNQPFKPVLKSKSDKE